MLAPLGQRRARAGRRVSGLPQCGRPARHIDEVGGRIEAQMHEPPAAAENAIEIRIDDISQLFHTLDPFPFRERDLDKDAEEFIVSWASRVNRLRW